MSDESLMAKLRRAMFGPAPPDEPKGPSAPVPARTTPPGVPSPGVPRPSKIPSRAFELDDFRRDLIERAARPMLVAGGIAGAPIAHAFSNAALQARREVLERAAMIAGTSLDDEDLARLLQETATADPRLLAEIATISGTLNPLEQAHRDAERLGSSLAELACVDELGPLPPTLSSTAAVRLFEAMVEVADACLYWVRDTGGCHCCGMHDPDASPPEHSQEGCPVGELAAALRAFAPSAEATEHAFEDLLGSLVDEAIEHGHPGGEFAVEPAAHELAEAVRAVLAEVRRSALILDEQPRLERAFAQFMRTTKVKAP